MPLFGFLILPAVFGAENTFSLPEKKMKLYRLLPSCFTGKKFALVLLFALILSGIGCSPDQDDDHGAFRFFPHKSRMVLVIPEAGSKLVRQFRFVDDDGIVRRTETEYLDGTTAITTHRPDGTEHLWSVYYPALSDGERRVKFEVLFDREHRYLSDRASREDGTREREGRRLADGSYDVVLYYEDGISINTHFVFASNGKQSESQAYRRNGSLLHSAIRVGFRMEITHFDEIGTRVKLEVVPPSGDVTTSFFDEAGRAVVLKVTHTNLETIAVYFDGDGNPSQRREFWTDRLFLDVFEKDKVIAFRQRWLRIGGSDRDPQYRLDGLVFFDEGGKIVKTIDFRGDGTIKEVVFIHNPGEFIEDRTFVRYDASGRLVRAYRLLGESGTPRELSEEEVSRYNARQLENRWMEFPEPHQWPERVIPPLGHSDLEE